MNDCYLSYPNDAYHVAEGSSDVARAHDPCQKAAQPLHHEAAVNGVCGRDRHSALHRRLDVVPDRFQHAAENRHGQCNHIGNL